jgi:hypothetical protein
MAITINNVTINNQLSIIFDAAVNKSNSNNGPRDYSGETEADVTVDGVGYFNIPSSDIIPSEVHALQFKPSVGTGHIEYTDLRDNLTIASESEIPTWAQTMVKRWNGEKAYKETYDTDFAANIAAEQDVDTAMANAVTTATAAKNAILNS